ncbi:hypothetical protein [Thioalkalivibrio sp.]|uniref:hypothetical protein n=1 Tax=Thioalkalivibrio sp. TaxID=2093813 RepID=UPI0039761155
MDENTRCRLFAKWVFSRIADGEDLGNLELLDQLEDLKLIEPRKHNDGRGISVSLFWAESEE